MALSQSVPSSALLDTQQQRQPAEAAPMEIAAARAAAAGQVFSRPQFFESMPEEQQQPQQTVGPIVWVRRRIRAD
jgi:hypothetical protein